MTSEAGDDAPRIAAPPRDEALPGLRVIDHDVLREALARHVPQCRAGLEPAQVTHVDLQYQPGRQANLLVRACFRDGSSTLRQQLFLKVLPTDESAPELPESVRTRYAEWRRTRHGRKQSPLEEPCLDLGDGVTAYAFPADPVVHSLVDAIDPAFLRRALHRAWQPRGVRVRRVDARALAYTPESRATLACEVLAEDETTAIPELRRLVAKLQVRKPSPHLFASHWAVWRETLGRVSVVPPVGCVAVAGIHLQELVTGRRLSDLAGRSAFAGHVRQAARAIAEVGATVLPLPQRRDARKECRTVERWVRVVSRLRPDLADRLARHGERLEEQIAARFQPCGTVHADFHLANVMVDRSGVTIIDWDQVAHGDPLLDAGRFLGAMRITALRVTGDSEGLADVADAFVETYLAKSGADERRLRLYESLALLMSSASPFRLQRQGWEEQAELLIEQSERALARAQAGPVVPVMSGTARLPHQARRDWALDRTLAQALLAPLLREREGSGLEITGCVPALVRDDGRLLHVKWSLEGWLDAKRWRGHAEGIAIAGQAGSTLHRHLETFHEARDVASAARGAASRASDESDEFDEFDAKFDESDEGEPTLVLPRPIGELAPLGMVVVEPERGRPLTSYLGGSRERRVLARLGQALGRLALVRLSLGARRGVSRESGSIVRRITTLRERGVGATDRIEEMRIRAARLAERQGLPLAPTARGAHLRDVVVRKDSMALRVVRELVSAPQPVAVASLLAALCSTARRGGATDAACPTLRDAFCEAAGLQPADLAPWEALLLLRRATRRLLDEPSDELAEALIADAASLLSRG